MSITEDPTLIDRAKASPCPGCSTCPRGSGEFCRDDVHDVQNKDQCAAACEQQGAIKYAFATVAGSGDTRCYCEGMTGAGPPPPPSSTNDDQLELKNTAPPPTSLVVHGAKASYGSDTCGGYKMVTKPEDGAKNAKPPPQYFSKIKVDSKSSAYCGCDASMMEQYNCKFPNNLNLAKGKLNDSSKTISQIFNTAVNNNLAVKGGPDNLYKEFDKQMNAIIDPDNTRTEAQKLERLKALVAFETCRFTNVSYPRGGSPINPNDPKTTQDEILQSWFKKFKTFFSWIVILMIIHITFRTFIPKGGNLEDSLLYAISLPPEFLEYDPKWKIIVTFVTIAVIFIVVGSLLWAHLGSEAQPPGTKALLNFYLPYSLPSFLKGGIMMSVYAMTFASIIRFGVGGSSKKGIGKTIMMMFSAIIFFVLWGVITGAVLHEKATDIWAWRTGTGDKPGNPIGIVMGVLLILTLLALIFGHWVPWLGDWMSFIVASGFGTFPLAVFFILLNFTITYWSASAEMGLLMLYRLAGAVWSFNPKSGIGKIILTILGVRPTDKWVLPFLPWVSLPVRAYYKATGEKTLPGYFEPRATSTGVSNTDIWFS